MSDDYKPSTLQDALLALATGRELGAAAKEVSEEAARELLKEEGLAWNPEETTAKKALELHELTERVLKARAEGLNVGEIALREGVSPARIRVVMKKVAERFKERQWTLYNELLSTRIARSEAVVEKVVKLMDSTDPYVVLAAHKELRADIEALPKIFGVTGNTNISTIINNNSLQLGGDVPEGVERLQKQMAAAIAALPEARAQFLGVLENQEAVIEAEVLPEPGNGRDTLGDMKPEDF